MAATYSVRTWDTELQDFTPDDGLPKSSGLTIHELRAALRRLQLSGYSCHRFKGGDSDPSVLVEREQAA